MIKLFTLIIFIPVLSNPSIAFSTDESRNASAFQLVFKVDFSQPSVREAFGGAPISYGANNVNLWASGGGMDVVFPAGTFGGSGGFGVYTQHRVETSTVKFRYSVFFPDDFDFVKGGKLSGLYGGRKDCAGGDLAEDCFSTRLMWRSDGRGELYLYANRAAQDPAICQMPNNHCNEDFGWSLNRGSFVLARGAWTDFEEIIVLNTPGQRNGVLEVKVNGARIIRYDNIVFRIAAYPNMKVEGMHVSTFFGGSDASWATPRRQVAKFKEFILENGLA